VVGDAAPEKLTRLETRLLEYFMLNKGQILPSQNIISQVWGPGGGSNEMLRQLVHRLREKIGTVSGEADLISNLPGVGYGFGI
jgi:DNA-binding response OmpR family regulator